MCYVPDVFATGAALLEEAKSRAPPVPASATATMSASHVSVADSLATYKAQLAALRGSAYSPRDARKALDLMHAAIELIELARRGHVDKSDIIAAVHARSTNTHIHTAYSAEPPPGVTAEPALASCDSLRRRARPSASTSVSTAAASASRVR